jgi:hypothetical protein
MVILSTELQVLAGGIQNIMQLGYPGYCGPSRPELRVGLVVLLQPAVT